jgi:hypothetical protein
LIKTIWASIANCSIFSNLALEVLCHLCATSFTILSSYPFIEQCMFRSNWPSSGVQVVVVKYSAAHCNAVFFFPIVVASGYFWLCGLYVVAFGFVCFTGCGCLECSCWAGVLLCVGRPS